MLRPGIDKKNSDLENIELLRENFKEHTTQPLNNLNYFGNSDNDYEYTINDKNELNTIFSYIDILEPYIKQLFENQEYITIKKSDTEERVYIYEQVKLINHIIDGNIIIRDKKFVSIINILKIFKHNEENRLKFVSEIKSLDPNKILDLIDDKYVELFGKQKDLDKPIVIDINLNKLGIPHLSGYNYLMTFERKRCTLKIESNELFLYYKLNGIDYKIILFIDKSKNQFGISINIGMKKTMIPYAHVHGRANEFRDECACLNYSADFIEYLQSFFDKTMFQAGYKKVPLDWENKYFDKLFGYHRINIYHVLGKKYPNYKFEVYYNWFNEKIDKNNKSHLSLNMS